MVGPGYFGYDMPAHRFDGTISVGHGAEAAGEAAGEAA